MCKNCIKITETYIPKLVELVNEKHKLSNYALMENSKVYSCIATKEQYKQDYQMFNLLCSKANKFNTLIHPSEIKTKYVFYNLDFKYYGKSKVHKQFNKSDSISFYLRDPLFLMSFLSSKPELILNEDKEFIKTQLSLIL